MARIRIDVHSHYLKLVNPPDYLKPLMAEFAYNFSPKNFRQKPGQRPIITVENVFAGRTEDKREYRFHANQLEELMQFFAKRGLSSERFEIVFHPLPEAEKIEIKMRGIKTAREDQIPYIEYLADPKDVRTKLVALQTGKGKGFISMSGVSALGLRTAVCVLPKYIEKWVIEIQELLDVELEDIVVVQGSKSLRHLLDMALNGELKYKFIIFSNTTLLNWITKYEKQIETWDYPIVPDELFPTLKVGPMIIDETHQHLHPTFKIILYSDITRLIGLSATLISEKPDIKRVHKVMYPLNIRMPEPELDKYIDVYSCAYGTRDPNHNLKTSEWGSTMYSHGAYETNILKRPYYKTKYMEIIKYLVNMGYHELYEEGDKLIVFAARIEMCNAIVEMLKKSFPQYDIRRYCENDPYENVIDADIRVTTIQSAGTAIDIPGLRAGIATNSVSSVQSNIQMIGRLRKNGNKDMRFYVMYNEAIPKQVEYNYRRKEQFKDRVKSFRESRLPVGL